MSVEPVEGADHQEAYQAAAKVLNGCFNVLAVRCKHISSLRGGYAYRNLDNPVDRGSADLVQITELDFGSDFPTEFTTDGGCRASAYFRRALTCDDPLDQVRYFCLAIEESGKKIKVSLGNNKTGEGRVIQDTIEEVYKKMSSVDRLTEIRRSLRDEMFSPNYRTGQVDAAMNDFLYQHVRCLVMHAGPTAASGSEILKDTNSPYDPEDRRKALEVLGVLRDVAQLYVLYDLQDTLGDPPPKAKKAKKPKKK